MALVIKSKTPTHETQPISRINKQAVLKMLGGITNPTLRKLIREGFPAPQYLGNKPLWIEADVMAWLTANLSTAPKTDTGQYCRGANL